jgi:transglutaminase-like putative cysteine protease
VVYRYSWIAGLASIGYAFWQLTGLLFPTESGAKWQLVVLSGLAIGLILTWTAITYRVRAIWIAMINVGALFVAATRFAAPSETFLIIPTLPGVAALWSDLLRAFDVIRHGVEPVRPITGLVVILTALFWLLGALLAWGLSKEHPFVALLPPLVVALQFATLDRRNDSLIILGAFVVLVAATILAVALDERDRGAGRMAGDRQRPPSNAPSTTAALLVAATVALAVVGASLLGPKLPTDGVLAWRTPGGLSGGFYGSSISYNPYVSIHEGLVSKTGTPLFRATIDMTAGDPGDVYFRLLTMETYRNGKWSASRPKVYELDETPLETEGYEYIGPTSSVTADIEIEALGQDWLPAPYAVGGAAGEDVDAFRIRRSDTALRFRGDLTYQGMRYRVTSEIPFVDPAAVAGVPGGGLSPLFTAAADGGETPPDPIEVELRELPDAEEYTDLPPEIDPRIRAQAIGLTERLTTPFEKGLAIEYWFRESGGFVYDLDVAQGHSDDILASWLFDDDPENAAYRRGYCEQFATSMAVMTRTIGIPTRVVLGFTPGDRVGVDEVVVRDDNAHSWVELWIPSQGWVSFDPTPRTDGANPATSYQAMESALGYDLAAYLGQIPEPEPIRFPSEGDLLGGIFAPDTDRPEPGFVGTGGETTSSSSLPSWIPIVGSMAALLILIALALPLIKWIRHRSRMRRLAEGDISAAWEEIVVRLTDFSEEPDPSSTPDEVAARVDPAMVPLAAVYTRSVYGGTGTVSDEQVESARRSMELTGDRLTTRYSPMERTRSYYRLGSLRRRFRR